MTRRARTLTGGLSLLPVALAFTACLGGTTVGPASMTATQTLTIFAAASLNGSLETAVGAYTTARPGTSITLAIGSSAALRTQIEQGAPADLFLSADTANPRALLDGGLVDGEIAEFARNELAIIVPARNPGRIASGQDLARPGLKIVAAGDQVPVTTYATQLVQRLSDRPDYPPDFAVRYDANIVSREDNVNAVVAKIELGEADAGIVYATDAAAARDVTTVEIPAGVNVTATYAGVVIRAGEHVSAARAFLAWLVGPDGQAVLAGFGFLPAAS